MITYPAPRYPRLKKPKPDEIMAKIRDLLGHGSGIQHSFRPDYNITKGDKILLVALSEHDPMVMNAVCEVIREMGALVDLFTIDSSPVAGPEELPAHEAIAVGKEEGDYSYYYRKMCDLIRPDTARDMIKQEKYTKLIAGAAGPPPGVPIPWIRFSFPYQEDYAGGIIDFPVDLWMSISRKSIDQIASCKVIKLTDPEGTEASWTNYEDDRPFIPGHMLGKPYNIGHGFGCKDDCLGIIAGTKNHLGAFPHIKVHLEGGQVVKVEGGGRYGEAWRERLEQYRYQKLPPLTMGLIRDSRPEKYQVADPGLFWYFECAIGAEPKVFRLPMEGRFQCHANELHERRRSGFIHHGFGPPTRGEPDMRAAGLPWMHVHVHSMFATLEGTTENGETVRIINKGHLTALDDPEVRERASRFGDPDDLLTESWIPAIPGINAPGDYMKDYAIDPVSWIMKEAERNVLWAEEM
jgi:hypothetical protein